IDSMCQNFWPMFLGGVCAAIAAGGSALKTGKGLLWPSAFPIVGTGTRSALPRRPYGRRPSIPTSAQPKTLGASQCGCGPGYAGAVGAWCFITIGGSEDSIGHMLCVAVTVGYTGGGAARNYGQPRLIQLHILFACGPMSLALLIHGGFYYIGLAVLLVLFFI